MRILLIGSGGREHALAGRLREENPRAELFCAPGNPGTAELGTNLALEATDLNGLVAWAKREKPNLTVVGPEAPLCAGVVDRFEAIGCPIFGPNRQAARLEGSKIFSKALLQRHHLPTAPGRAFTGYEQARLYLQEQDTYPCVIKADGLAAGKGVMIAEDCAAAEQALQRLMQERVFGAAGDGVLIEQFSRGREISVHVLTDGRDHVMLPIAQDHKKLGDGDTGPNTGGMGAYAPAPFATPTLLAQIERQAVAPVLAALHAEALDFCGVLYIGLIWTETGPSILEFNVRFGDPELQVLLPLLETPLVPLFQAVIARRLGQLPVQTNARHAVTLVLAAAGYPDRPESGAVISGLELNLPGTAVFHAGTRQEGRNVVTNGGRVLNVTAWAADLETARAAAYERAAKIDFAGKQIRHDIARRLTLE